MRAIVVAMLAGCVLWPAPARAAEGPLDVRVTIDYRNASGADVIGALARGAGLKVEVGPGTLQPVTITLTNVKLANALNAVCDSALCLWRFDGGLRITPLPSEQSASLPPLVSFEVHDTSVSELFRALAAAINVAVTIDPSLPSNTVSMVIKNTSTAEALNLLCNIQQCEWDFDPVRGLRITQKR